MAMALCIDAMADYQTNKSAKSGLRGQKGQIRHSIFAQWSH